VLPLEIPRTSIASQKSSGFGTVYDSDAGDSKDKTYKRARDAYDLFVQHIEVSIRNAWGRQATAGGEGGLYGTTSLKAEIGSLS
jgi:chromosome partitioning protein